MLKAFFDKNLLEAGCDEAGRGCLAGPVFAAAVIFNKKYRNKWLNDSKKLSDKMRYELRPEIEASAISWAIGIVDQNEIDEINILQASLLAMKRAIIQLPVKPYKILVDGLHKPDINYDMEAIIKGDSFIDEISAASIIAKVERDKYMIKIDAKYPGYGLKVHKGYGTKLHFQKIKDLGASDIHRMTFKGVMS